MNERIRFTLKHPAGLPAPGHEHGLAGGSGSARVARCADRRLERGRDAGVELSGPCAVRRGRFADAGPFRRRDDWACAVVLFEPPCGRRHPRVAFSGRFAADPGLPLGDRPWFRPAVAAGLPAGLRRAGHGDGVPCPQPRRFAAAAIRRQVALILVVAGQCGADLVRPGLRVPSGRFGPPACGAACRRGSAGG